MNLFLHALLNRLIIDAYNVYYLLHKHVGIIIKTIYIAIFKNRNMFYFYIYFNITVLYLLQYYTHHCTLYNVVLPTM